MKLIEKLFGKWEVVERFSAECKSTYVFLNASRVSQVLVVIEKNSKTGKLRGYYKSANGIKVNVDPEWAMEYLK